MQTSYTLRMPLRGRLFLLGWAGVLCLCAAPFLPIARPYPALVYLCLVAGVLGWCWWYSGRYFIIFSLVAASYATQGHPAQQPPIQATARAPLPAQLCIRRGRLWQRVHYIPRHAIYRYGCYTTPLLRRLDCCIFVCQTAKNTLLLPPLANRALAPLLRDLREFA